MKISILLLPVYLISSLTNNNSVWNIARIIFGQKLENHKIINSLDNPLFNTFNESILQVFYPKGSYSPSKTPVGGIGFYSSPKEIFMTNEVIFKYDVYFDPSFQPNLGGKLPGLFIGNGTSRSNFTSAAGGVHSLASSCRIAWRANLYAEAYVYLPDTQLQHPDYYNIPNFVENKIYGDSLWRGLFKFEKNKWNTVSIRLKTNTITDNKPNYDGLLQIKINNITNTFNKMIWRVNENYNISAIIFETFFGGSTINTATPVDTWTYFKNIQIQKIN